MGRRHEWGTLGRVLQVGLLGRFGPDVIGGIFILDKGSDGGDKLRNQRGQDRPRCTVRLRNGRSGGYVPSDFHHDEVDEDVHRRPLKHVFSRVHHSPFEMREASIDGRDSIQSIDEQQRVRGDTGRRQR